RSRWTPSRAGRRLIFRPLHAATRCRPRLRHVSGPASPWVEGRFPVRGEGGFSMLSIVRAGFAAALIAFSFVSAHAADKPYHRDDLADSAIRLEAQIRQDVGQVAKPLATL